MAIDKHVITVMHGANLRRAKLEHADLCDVNFRGANLEWADLRWTDLIIFDFTGANLERTDFHKADKSPGPGYAK